MPFPAASLELKPGSVLQLAEDSHLHDKYTDSHSRDFCWIAELLWPLESCSFSVPTIRNPTQRPQIPHGM